MYFSRGEERNRAANLLNGGGASSARRKAFNCPRKKQGKSFLKKRSPCPKKWGGKETSCPLYATTIGRKSLRENKGGKKSPSRGGKGASMKKGREKKRKREGKRNCTQISSAQKEKRVHRGHQESRKKKRENFYVGRVRFGGRGGGKKREKAGRERERDLHRGGDFFRDPPLEGNKESSSKKIRGVPSLCICH